VDVPVLGMRLNEFRNSFLLPEDMEWPNILSNGADTSNKTDYGEPPPSELNTLMAKLTELNRSKSRLGKHNPLAPTTHLDADLAERKYVTHSPSIPFLYTHQDLH
jgi:hypothetical protein